MTTLLEPLVGALQHARNVIEIVRIPVESSGSGFHMLSSSGNAGNSFL